MVNARQPQQQRQRKNNVSRGNDNIVEGDESKSLDDASAMEMSRRLVKNFVMVSRVPRVRKTNESTKKRTNNDRRGGDLRRTPLRRY